jgi:hypothetical protein
VVARDEWERERLLRHFLDLPAALFQEAFASDLARIGCDAGGDRRAQLAWLAMDAGGPFHRRFALGLLFDALGEMPDAPGLPSHREFVRLTGDRGLSVAASEGEIAARWAAVEADAARLEQQRQAIVAEAARLAQERQAMAAEAARRGAGLLRRILARLDVR